MVDLAPTIPSHSDHQLLAGIAAHDAPSLEELYRRYFTPTYALAARMLGAGAIAESCAHRAFLQLWQNPPADLHKQSLLDWLLCAIRELARAQIYSSSSAAPPAIVDEFNPDSDQAALTPQQQAVRSVLSAMEQSQRLVLESAYFDCLTHGEIAQRYQLSVDAVKIYLRTGMALLQTALLQPALD